MKLIIPTSTPLDLDLPDVEIVKLSEFEDVPEEHRDAEAAVLWGMQARVSKFVDQLPNVRWYQTLAAGPDGLLNSNLGDDVVVTNGVHFHDRPVAEHAAALTLALTNRIPEMLEHKREHYWSDFGRPALFTTASTFAQQSNPTWSCGDSARLVSRLRAYLTRWAQTSRALRVPQVSAPASQS